MLDFENGELRPNQIADHFPDLQLVVANTYGHTSEAPPDHMMPTRLAARLLVKLDGPHLSRGEIYRTGHQPALHSRDLIKEGLAIEKLVLVQAWHEAGDLFDVRERGALAWAETLTRVAETATPDTAFLAASSQFSEKELADLTIAVGLMNAYNRLAIGFRRPPRAAVGE